LRSPSIQLRGFLVRCRKNEKLNENAGEEKVIAIRFGLTWVSCLCMAGLDDGSRMEART